MRGAAKLKPQHIASQQTHQAIIDCCSQRVRLKSSLQGPSWDSILYYTLLYSTILYYTIGPAFLFHERTLFGDCRALSSPFVYRGQMRDFSCPQKVWLVNPTIWPAPLSTSHHQELVTVRPRSGFLIVVSVRLPKLRMSYKIQCRDRALNSTYSSLCGIHGLTRNSDHSSYVARF